MISTHRKGQKVYPIISLRELRALVAIAERTAKTAAASSPMPGWTEEMQCLVLRGHLSVGAGSKSKKDGARQIDGLFTREQCPEIFPR